jgi:hypothetical protein
VKLRNTIAFNSTGLPAISIPIGLTKERQIQYANRSTNNKAPFKEDLILSIAYNYERINDSMDKFMTLYVRQAIKSEADIKKSQVKFCHKYLIDEMS